MVERLPYKVDIIHGVGLANTLEGYKNFGFIDDIKSDIKQAAASQKRFLNINEQLKVFKDIVQSTELTMLTYANIYKGFALKCLERNVLTYDHKQSKLNLFGLHIRNVQRAIDYSSVVNVGSLLQFYVEGSNSLETAELTVKNYYQSLNISPLLSPKEKHNLYISRLTLDDIDWLDLEKQILDSFNTDIVAVQKFRKSRVLREFIVNNINARFLLGNMSRETIEYFQILYTNDLLSIDLASLFYQVITYDLIGSTLRFYLALAAEALITASYYILNLDPLISTLRIEDFSQSNYLEERQQLASYLALVRNIFYVFSELNIFAEAETIYQGFYTDVAMYIVEPNTLSNDYTLGEFY